MSDFTEYENYDALGLARLVRDGDVSAGEVLDAAIARAGARNPRINALCHDLHDRARAAIGAGLPDGPFAGVPFLLKDLYALLEGAPICNGSRMFDGYVCDHDTELVARHKRAGLVIFGRTASPEFGLCYTTEPRVHGPTRNPWDTERVPGGPSGGAAATVAAGGVPANRFLRAPPPPAPGPRAAGTATAQLHLFPRPSARHVSQGPGLGHGHCLC